MQDKEIVYRIELTNEEYKILENQKKELYNNTVYKVNTYFSKDSEYTILQDLFRIFRK